MNQARLAGYIAVVAASLLALSFIFPPFFYVYLASAPMVWLLGLNRRLAHAELVLVALVTFSVLIAITRLFGHEPLEWKRVIIVVCHLFFALGLRHVRLPRWQAIIPLGVVVFCFASMAAIGVAPNQTMPDNSENFISVVLIGSLGLYAVLGEIKRVNLLHIAVAAIFLLFALWAKGRANIASSLMLIALFAGAFTVRILAGGASAGIKRFAAISVLTISVVIGVGALFYLIDLNLAGDFSSKGFKDRSRSFMLENYFESLEPAAVFLGRDLNSLEFLDRWDGNPHNSYLAAHAFLGLLYVVTILLCAATVILRTGLHPFLSIVIFVLSARALTDINVIAGRYDVVYFSAFLLSLSRDPTVQDQ